MMIKKRSFWNVLTLCCLMMLTLAWPAFAQTPTPPTPREALIQEIQARARRDIELDKPAKDIMDLEILFGDEAADVGLSMAQVLEIYEEAYTAAKPSEPWWSDLRPEADWIVAAILFVLFILRDVLKENLTKLINWIWERLYKILSGWRPLWGIALRRYRKALVTRYERLKIPFRPGHPLDMREVYVPLKMSEASDTKLIDAHQAIGEHKLLMVTGAPGSGKSVLLRHLTLRYAESDLTDIPERPIPVLLELSRLSESEETLEPQLAQLLKNNDFPGGERFLKAGLKRGLLLLLFDGLDEVTGDTRDHLVRQIKDLLHAHPDCRAVITCRTAVYDGEFDDTIDQRLEIAPFSDQQIQRFLNSWESEMPMDKSPTHLLRNLRERPHIMRLARNPLLLTIIAYLYADTPFVLPHSRSAFYGKAITVLLEQWDRVKGRRNQFTADEKLLILQHLALFNQERSATQGHDRRSTGLTTVLQEIKKVLPSINRRAEDARLLLNEIVERSGLLLALDGGLRYQFTHLTLQEFFAAQALQDDANSLIAHFKTDPDAWRETVKLWCGLAHNSTNLIRAIYDDHPITAFECLGDAQKVDVDIANCLMTAFKARLGKDCPESEPVTRAFATVATNPQVRGRQVLDFLVGTVTSVDECPSRRQAAGQALALTNLPQAAEVLGELALDHPDARPWLIQMGDLAVPILSKWACRRFIWAFDGLLNVGTPDAACALADLLWDDNTPMSYWAAWRLAVLLSDANVESTLRDYPLKEEQQEAERLEWVWEPFEPDPNSPLRIIAGRTAHLLYTTPEKQQLRIDEVPDVRLLVPLCSVAAVQDHHIELDQETRAEIGNRWQRLIQSSPLDWVKSKQPAFVNRAHKESAGIRFPSSEVRISDLSKNAKQDFVDASCKELSQNRDWENLFRKLPLDIQFGLLLRLARDTHAPDKKDWRNIRVYSEYDFAESYHIRLFKVFAKLLIIINVLYLVGIIGGIIFEGPIWLVDLILLVLGWGILFLYLWRLEASWTLDIVELLQPIWMFGSTMGVSLAIGILWDNWLASVLFNAGGFALFNLQMEGIKDIKSATISGIGIGLMNYSAVQFFNSVVGGSALAALGTTFSCFIVGLAVGLAKEKSIRSIVLGISSLLTGGLIGSIVTYGPSLFVSNLLGLKGLFGFWGILLAATSILYRDARQRQREAENPLYGLLFINEQTPTAPRRPNWVPIFRRALAPLSFLFNKDGDNWEKT
jgi:hypothetical protein